MAALSTVHSLLPLPHAPDDPLLDHWYHTIDFGRGMVSKGFFDHRGIVDLYGIPESLEGMTVLDVGTGDGFFAFEMERRGAARVVAIDVDSVGECDWLRRARSLVPDVKLADQSWKTHFRMAHTLLGSKVERITMNVYDLSPERLGTFDFVFSGDVLLHLQNPLLMLQNIRSVARDAVVVETIVDEALEKHFPEQPFVRFGAAAYEKSPGDMVTYWSVNTRSLETMLVYAGFETTEPQGTFRLPPHGLPATSVLARTT